MDGEGVLWFPKDHKIDHIKGQFKEDEVNGEGEVVWKEDSGNDKKHPKHYKGGIRSVKAL